MPKSNSNGLGSKIEKNLQKDMSTFYYIYDFFFNSDSRSWAQKWGEDVVKIFVIDGLCRDCQIVAYVAFGDDA